jgi:chromosome segregation ATPase
MSESKSDLQLAEPAEFDAAPTRSLARDIGELSQAVGTLDAQLRRIIRINRALEADLALSRKRVKHLTGERERLIMAIGRKEEEALMAEDLRTEVEQLHWQRKSLATRVHSLSRALATSEQRVLEIVRVLDRFRVERDGASQEAMCLDAQFTRAMKVIEKLRTELGAAVNQRASLQVELAESRRALEQIRKSILDASRK